MLSDSWYGATTFLHRHGRVCLGHLRTTAEAQMAG